MKFAKCLRSLILEKIWERLILPQVTYQATIGITFSQIMNSPLTHFFQMHPFSTLWGFLMFSGCIRNKWVYDTLVLWKKKLLDTIETLSKNTLSHIQKSSASHMDLEVTEHIGKSTPRSRIWRIKIYLE